MQTIDQECKTVGSSAYWGSRGNWFIAAVMHRDSDCLSRSNFEVMQAALKNDPACKEWTGEFSPVTVERFNSWLVGWVDYLVVDPDCKPLVALAESLRKKLEDYPILDEQHFSYLEMEEANETWRNCYNARERVKYIREHKSQFEFRGLADMIGCVRGNYFAGYASELIS